MHRNAVGIKSDYPLASSNLNPEFSALTFSHGKNTAAVFQCPGTYSQTEAGRWAGDWADGLYTESEAAIFEDLVRVVLGSIAFLEFARRSCCRWCWHPRGTSSPTGTSRRAGSAIKD